MMKKILLGMLMLFAGISVNAQIIRADELEKYAKEKYGSKWQDAAMNLSHQIELDKNKALTYVQVIECPGKSVQQLYIILNYWFTTVFNDEKNTISLNDKELGTIIGHSCVDGIAKHTGGMNDYVVDIKPVIKADIKEGRVRVTYSLPYYTVRIVEGGGILGQIADIDDPLNSLSKKKKEEKWALDACYPFVPKDSHKRTSSKALVMAHACSNVILDRIEEALKNGVVGNEDEDW